MSLTRRVGNLQPFLRSNSREDNRYQGLQAGFVTYEQASTGDDDAYQISYVELGGRSDHLHDAFTVAVEADASPLQTAAPLPEDAALIRKVDTPAK